MLRGVPELNEKVERAINKPYEMVLKQRFVSEFAGLEMS
jgi:hypothetical protein